MRIQHVMGLCLALLTLSGCVHRSLTIRTDPPGAQVYMNDQWIGETPFAYDFEWYGWYRVLIRKDGYERLEDHRRISAPPHLWIPMDLVMELLPLDIRDDRKWSYTLTPMDDAITLSRPTKETRSKGK